MLLEEINYNKLIFLVDSKLTKIKVIKEPLVKINNKKINDKKIFINIYKNKINLCIFKENINNLSIKEMSCMFYINENAIYKRIIDGTLMIDQIFINIIIDQNFFNIEINLKIINYRQKDYFDIHKKIKNNLLENIKNYKMSSILNLSHKNYNTSICIRCKSYTSNLVEFWNKSMLLENALKEHEINYSPIFYEGLIEWKI